MDCLVGCVVVSCHSGVWLVMNLGDGEARHLVVRLLRRRFSAYR